MTKTSEKIFPVLIEEEMRNSYIDYSMSVIVARALPDIRDGLKPVHRRVLYGMLELGLRPHTAYKKSARIVGEVLGKYHPHGDTAVYDTMVRMVQDFSLRYPLVDGQGNFGSIDGDSPAAMRYTEARLSPISEEVLRDIEKNTVDFIPNFDESLKEPSVLPSLLPTLLINGAAGIAVGMATNIPPHNLGEVIDALVALIDKPSLKPEKIRDYMSGPDFPTGAIIFGDENIDSYFQTGRGKLTVRARVHVEEMRGSRECIVITEIPYQVNKSTLIEKIASLVRDKKIEGVAEIRDESDREGMRVVIELRRDIDAEAIIKNLFKHTQMQTTFGVILLALVDGQPKVLNVKEMLNEFLKFRHEIILRRTKYELELAEKRAHILEGLKIALDNIDEVVDTIKKSRTVDTARLNLMKRFALSEVQAQAILDMRLQRLTGLERKKIEQEYLNLIKLIEKLKSLLSSKERRMQLVKKELLELKEKYADSRRTQIIGEKSESPAKSLITEEETLVTLSLQGVVRRFSAEAVRANKELVKSAEPGDFVESLFYTSNSHNFLFFTDQGRCYNLRASYIPLASANENGVPVGRLVHLKPDEKIVRTMEFTTLNEEKFVTIATMQGVVKKVALSSLSKPSEDGFNIISLKDKDRMVDAVLTSGGDDVLIASAQGFGIRFSEQDIRDMGLQAAGVRGMSLAQNDKVIGLITLRREKSTLLTVTDLGFGKRNQLDEYNRIKRGGKGIVTYKISDKVGHLAAVLEVQENDEILFITRKGKVKRLKAKFVKVMGRSTQGMAVANIAKNDVIDRAIFAPKIRSS